MNADKLNESIKESERFLEKAKKLKSESDKSTYYWGKMSASVKRASMDLTNSLAELRNLIKT